MVKRAEQKRFGFKKGFARMFLLKKIVTPFLLPPGVLVLLLIAGAIWTWRRKGRGGGWMLLAAASLLWLASMGVTADCMMGRLEADLTIPPLPPADVIIMLGGAAYDQVPDLSGQGTPGPGTMERMVTAARLQRRLGVPIIVSGGRVYPTSASIATVTRRFLVDLGIPADQILMEDQSRDTYENALFSKQLCDRAGFDRPLLVTSGFHLKRAMYCFESVGLAVTPFPCALTTWPGKPHSWNHFLPSAQALAGTVAALHEGLGLAYYRMVY
jgi:uncharacterized SAM-binding protein YcdF (DUF218 family)